MYNTDPHLLINRIHNNTNPEIAMMVKRTYPDKDSLNIIVYNLIKFIVVRSLARHSPLLLGMVLLAVYFKLSLIAYPVVLAIYLTKSCMSPFDGSKTLARPTLISIIGRLNDISCEAIRNIYKVNPDLIYDKDLMKMITNISIVSDFLIGSKSDVHDGAMLKLATIETVGILGFLKYYSMFGEEDLRQEVNQFISTQIEDCKLIDSQYKINVISAVIR